MSVRFTQTRKIRGKHVGREAGARLWRVDASKEQPQAGRRRGDGGGWVKKLVEGKTVIGFQKESLRQERERGVRVCVVLIGIDRSIGSATGGPARAEMPPVTLNLGAEQLLQQALNALCAHGGGPLPPKRTAAAFIHSVQDLGLFELQRDQRERKGSLLTSGVSWGRGGP